MLSDVFELTYEFIPHFSSIYTFEEPLFDGYT